MSGRTEPGSTLRGAVVRRDAVVTLVVFTSGGDRLERTAVVDTGCQKSLILPPLLFEKVRRTPRLRGTTALADGTVAEHPEASVRVELCGVARNVLAGCLGRDVLLGMALLAGHRLTVDAAEGGPVTISPLAQSPA